MTTNGDDPRLTDREEAIMGDLYRNGLVYHQQLPTFREDPNDSDREDWQR